MDFFKVIITAFILNTIILAPQSVLDMFSTTPSPRLIQGYCIKMARCHTGDGRCYGAAMSIASTETSIDPASVERAMKWVKTEPMERSLSLCAIPLDTPIH